MKYEDIKDFSQRCEEHPDHQSGMITNAMIQMRLMEEIDELRNYIEQTEKQEPDLSIEANRVAYEVAMHYANKTKETLSRKASDIIAEKQGSVMRDRYSDIDGFYTMSSPTAKQKPDAWRNDGFLHHEARIKGEL